MFKLTSFVLIRWSSRENVADSVTLLTESPECRVNGIPSVEPFTPPISHSPLFPASPSPKHTSVPLSHSPHFIHFLPFQPTLNLPLSLPPTNQPPAGHTSLQQGPVTSSVQVNHSSQFSPKLNFALINNAHPLLPCVSLAALAQSEPLPPLSCSFGWLCATDNPPLSSDYIILLQRPQGRREKRENARQGSCVPMQTGATCLRNLTQREGVGWEEGGGKESGGEGRERGGRVGKCKPAGELIY